MLIGVVWAFRDLRQSLKDSRKPIIYKESDNTNATNNYKSLDSRWTDPSSSTKSILTVHGNTNA
jgi:hypothetical protein